eukprot:1487451-Pyramimonas_sp.AAC.1
MATPIFVTVGNLGFACRAEGSGPPRCGSTRYPRRGPERQRPKLFRARRLAERSDTLSARRAWRVAGAVAASRYPNVPDRS